MASSRSKRWYNFTNITKLLAVHHQHWMCLQMLGPSGTFSSTYLYSGDDVAEGKSVQALEEPNVARIMELDSNSTMLVTPRISVRGRVYSDGIVLLQSLDDEPQFVCVKKIFLVSHAKLLQCCYLKIVYFDEHTNMLNETNSGYFVHKTTRIKGHKFITNVARKRWL